MIKKLINKIEIRKELELIKKHYRSAKRHRSETELDNVKRDLLKLHDRAVENDLMDLKLTIEIRCLFEIMYYFKIQHLEKSRHFTI